jgi:uncharacterized protein (DUF2249 family)
MTMIIHENVKIGAIIQYNEAALDAIISISPRFEKLRNPLLRKLIGGRTTIAQASKIGKCLPEDFYTKLIPLGFEVKPEITANLQQNKVSPPFTGIMSPEQVITFDVRPVLDSGADPLKQIMSRIKDLQIGQALKIIADFEPTPLITLLKKQGYGSYVSRTGDDIVETVFYKETDRVFMEPDLQKPGADGWDELIAKYKNKLQSVDVKNMEIGKPMHIILSMLEKIANDEALFVYHERIPVYLIPELEELGFDIRIKENSDTDINLLIFRN